MSQSAVFPDSGVHPREVSAERLWIALGDLLPSGARQYLDAEWFVEAVTGIMINLKTIMVHRAERLSEPPPTPSLRVWCDSKRQCHHVMLLLAMKLQRKVVAVPVVDMLYVEVFCWGEHIPAEDLLGMLNANLATPLPQRPVMPVFLPEDVPHMSSRSIAALVLGAILSLGASIVLAFAYAMERGAALTNLFVAAVIITVAYGLGSVVLIRIRRGLVGEYFRANPDEIGTAILIGGISPLAAIVALLTLEE